MSYTSTSTFPRSARLGTVREIIFALGYKRYRSPISVPNLTDSCFWYDENEYRSWVGVELDIYRTPAGRITVYTRSRVSRSYWDLDHQNRTIKLLRDALGGSFTTDEGKDRYLRPGSGPPTPLASGCYLARSRYHNALITARTYLDNRKLADENKKLIRFVPYTAAYTPIIISNNLLLPFLVAIWEEYFRSIFTALLQHSTQRQAALKRVRLTSFQLEGMLTGSHSIERSLAETFSFQRPSIIADNFKQLDRKLDVGGVLLKPYRRRRKSLHDSLEELVERRNAFVHTGEIFPDLDRKMLTQFIADFEVAADRAYNHIGQQYGFVPIRHF